MPVFVGSEERRVLTTSGTDLDVEGRDANLLAADSDVLSSQHSGVGRGLVTIGLDLHTAGNTDDGFATTEWDHRRRQPLPRIEFLKPPEIPKPRASV